MGIDMGITFGVSHGQDDHTDQTSYILFVGCLLGAFLEKLKDSQGSLYCHTKVEK